MRARLLLGVAGTVAAAMVLPVVGAEAQTAPSTAKACEVPASVGDTREDVAAIDIVVWQIRLGCEADWSFDFATLDTWADSSLNLFELYLDTDGIDDNGCDGFDYAVLADLQGGEVYRTPDCDDNGWVQTGDTILTRREYNGAAVRWTSESIGDPTGPVWLFAAITNTIDDSVEFAPDSDLHQVGSGGPRRHSGFSNGRCQIPYDETATNNSVARLYEAYFRRPADSGGLGYWVPRYRSGQLCLTDISEYFAGSAEFRSTYGSVDNRAFVQLVYENVLDREPDSAGYNYWVDQLANRGIRRGTMMVGFSESPEFRSASGLP